MAADPRLRELLKRWRELRRTGRRPSLEELCRACPELLPELRLRLEESIAENSAATAASVFGGGLDRQLDDVTRPHRSDNSQNTTSTPTRHDSQLTAFQSALIAGADVSGTTLGEYTLLERIGAGGMGVVFKARHRRMNRTVAVKLLARDCVDSPAAIARFQREVQAAARLSHPNVVTAYDAGEHEGVLYLAMEYIEGIDLGRHLRQHGPLPLERALGCVQQAARALEYAHAQGVVHRDVKPTNLLLDRTGVVKMLDLGLARLRQAGPGGDDVPLTQTGACLGTPDYTAPEQNDDPAGADERADIYSLGCTLFSLLTGRTLYDEKTLMNKMLAHRDRPIPSLSQHCPAAPPALDAVFRRMVAKKPGDRYASMGEVLRALDACPAPSAMLVTAPSAMPITAPSLTLVTAPTATLISTPVAQRPRAGLWMGAAAAAAVLVLLTMAGAVWLLAGFIRTPVKNAGPVRSASAPPVGITGRWSGLYMLEGVECCDSLLEVEESTDGSLTGTWETAAINGKRRGKHELQWDSARQIDGYEYHAVARTLDCGEIMSITFTAYPNVLGEQNLGRGVELLVRTPGAPVTQRVEFAGKWNGLYRDEFSNGSDSPLDLTEMKDGTLTGSWDGVPMKGKRTGDAAFEITGDDGNGTKYRLTGKATNGGRVLRLTYTATLRVKRQETNYRGLALQFREE